MLLLLFMIVMIVFAKDIYVYDTPPLAPWQIPSSTEQLLPATYVCKTGWFAIMTPPYITTYICDLQFTNNGVTNVTMTEPVDASMIVAIDGPWHITGDCDSEVIHVCEAPSDTIQWTPKCENAVLASYHLCTKATLVGMHAAAIMDQWTPYHNNPTQMTRAFVIPPRENITTITAECSTSSECSIDDFLLLVLLIIMGVVILYAGSLGMFAFIFWKYHRRVLRERDEKGGMTGTPMSHFEAHMT